MTANAFLKYYSLLLPIVTRKTTHTSPWQLCDDRKIVSKFCSTKFHSPPSAFSKMIAFPSYKQNCAENLLTKCQWFKIHQHGFHSKTKCWYTYRFWNISRRKTMYDAIKQIFLRSAIFHYPFAFIMNKRCTNESKNMQIRTNPYHSY